ncbi:unnamed protein product, partial [Didymodactylos carnosus]
MLDFKNRVKAAVRRQQKVKFEFEGEKRVYFLRKPLLYEDLISFINQAFGANIDIRCLFSRDLTICVPVTCQEDLDNVLSISEANSANKLNLLLARKKTISEIVISDDSETLDLTSAMNVEDSPPPGTIGQKKRITQSNSAPSINGDRFIPEHTKHHHSSGSSISSCDSRGSENHSRYRRLPAGYSITRNSSNNDVRSAMSTCSLSSAT